MDKAEDNIAYFNSNEWLRQEYRGIQILKYPSDLEHYKKILAETKPDLIIETGTLDGASAAFYKDHSRADVITIDVDNRVKDKRPDITYLLGSSINLLMTNKQLIGKHKRIMVILDADHRKDHVLAELKLYAPLVSKGCYLVVEDTFISQYLHNQDQNNDYSGGSSWEALQKWDSKNFQVQSEPYLTMNPGGWFKRV